MSVAIGAFVQPNYNAPFTPGPSVTLKDPAFAGQIDTEILGGGVGSSRQASFLFMPQVMHAFYSWRGYSPTTVPSGGGTPLSTAGVRYVSFDDTPAITVVNKYANGTIAVLCFASAHSFYVGQFVTIAGAGSSFNGTVQVTAINSAVGTGVTTVYNITFANTAVVSSAASSGTVAAGAAYYVGSTLTPWTNTTDTTGLNTSNLGPRRYIDYIRALYTAQGATPPAVLITWRSGAMNSSHNMENAVAWQQTAGGVDEFFPSAIASGTHDAYIQAFASQLADYIFANQTQVIQLRLDQEANGNNYGWAYNNQWLEPTANIQPGATPDTGPALLNALVPTTTSGNPIATSGGSSGVGGYGRQAGMYRHVITLVRSTILNQLEQVHGMSSGAAATLAANVQMVWCLGSGSLITPSTGAPIANPPFPQIPHLYNGEAFAVTGATATGTAVTLTVAPGTDYVANATAAYSLVGHGLPVGSQVAVSGTGTALDGTTVTVTAITNTTITFASGLSSGAAAAISAGSVTLASVSSYVQSCAAWASFYPGDDVVDIVSLDGYNPGKTAGTWKNFMVANGSSPGIFANAYPAVVGFVGSSKPFQISETGCVEGVAGTPSKAAWIDTNLLSGTSTGGAQTFVAGAVAGQSVSATMPRVASVVYFDQGGRNSGYQVRTSNPSLVEWQRLSTDTAWTKALVIPSFPPITTGIPPTIIVIRNNTSANLAGETSNAVGELVIDTTNERLLLGDGVSAIPSLPALPFPTAAPTAGQVLTATSPTTAAWEPAASATNITATNGSVLLGADLTLTPAATNVVLTTPSLAVGTYLVTASIVRNESTTTTPVDFFLTAGTATITPTIPPGGESAKGNASATAPTCSFTALVSVTAAGTITLNAYFTTSGAAPVVKRYTTAGATTVPASSLSWVRVA